MVDRNYNNLNSNNFGYNNSHQGAHQNMNPYSRQGRVHTNLNQVSDQERMNAKEALASLKMKTNSQRAQTNNIMPPYNNSNKYVPSYEMESKLSGGGINKGIGNKIVGGYSNYQPRQPQKYQPQQLFNPYPQQQQQQQKGNQNSRSKLNTTNSTRPRMNINLGVGGNEMEDNRPLDKGGDMNNYDVNEYEDLSPCPDCDKMFAPGPLAKHIKICKKVFGKQRKAFDSKKKRIVDSEQASLMKQGEIDSKKREKLISNKKKSNLPKWKKQSEELRKIAQRNKEYAGNRGDVQVLPNKGMNGKGGLSASNKMPQFQSSANDDYILCKFCNRSYEEETYNRHAPGCERRFKEKQMKSGNVSNQPKKNFQSKPFGKK